MSKAPAVDYCLQIIEFFSKSSTPVGIADISSSLDINKNAVSRILGSLKEYGWIYCCDEVQKKYLLTLKPFSLTSKNINESTLVKTASTFLKKLNEKLGDAVYLGVKKEKTVLYLLHYDSTKEVRINGCVGGEYPLHTSAPGKILLSWSNNEVIKKYFKNENAEFLIQAERIRHQGYSTDNEEFAKGVICYAAPVFNSNGEVVAAVGISSLTIYDSIDTLIKNKGKAVSECAKSISKTMGYIY